MGPDSAAPVPEFVVGDSRQVGATGGLEKARTIDSVARANGDSTRHGTGYRAGIPTNSIAELGPSWRSLVPLDELFDVVVESCDVGMRKPDPQVYALALERLGVSAARTVFIDDWPGHVAAAERLGMTGIVMGDDRSAALDELDALIPLG